MLDLESGDIILSRQRTTMVLIRLRGRAGRSAPLLFAYGINRFSHDATHVYAVLYASNTDADQPIHPRCPDNKRNAYIIVKSKTIRL